MHIKWKLKKMRNNLSTYPKFQAFAACSDFVSMTKKLYYLRER